jgi:hypothetical protein
LKPFVRAEVPRLERVDEQLYINLYPENVFGLAVDGDLCEVPHIYAWNPVLVESSFHPSSDRTISYPPGLLSDTGIRFIPTNPDQSPPPIRPHRTPVYIPTIPRYIDACLSRHPRLCLPDAPRFAGNANMDISYLIRYLFLEIDAQRAKLLPALADERKEVMKAMLDRYKRMVKADLRFSVNSKEALTSKPPKAK